MSALLAGSKGFDPVAFERAREDLGRQGLGLPQAFECGDARLLWYPGYDEQPCDDACVRIGDGFIVRVGTLFYRERGGRAALQSLWHDFTSPQALSADEPWGNYVVAIAKGGRLWLFCDRLGMVKLYERSAERLLSTSWLACAAAGSRSKLDRIGAIDYVLGGASHGLRTPVEQVRLVEPTLAAELANGTTLAVSSAPEWFSHPKPASVSQALEEAVELLRARARAIHAAFDGEICGALSGGFDSRLILAAMRSVGAAPRLHVYGPGDDADVSTARKIAAALGVPLRHVDKAALTRKMQPLTHSEATERMRFFDGIPIDGIFDRGADRSTRLEQSAGGAIALNGGGGEILRNFFYLSDRRFTVPQIVQTFYGNHDPAVARRVDDLNEYADYLGQSISAQIGHGGLLAREEVEAIYPLLRGRYWTSRNNSVAARCGHFLTPLLDPPLVRLSLALPLSWKDYGRFEGRLIAALDPTLGELPLSYGFSPRDGPGLDYRARMWIQHRRPPFVRARTVRLKRFLGRLGAPAQPTDSAALLPGSRRIDSLLDIAKLADDGQAARALTLEFLIRALDIG